MFVAIKASNSRTIFEIIISLCSNL